MCCQQVFGKHTLHIHFSSDVLEGSAYATWLSYKWNWKHKPLLPETANNRNMRGVIHKNIELCFPLQVKQVRIYFSNIIKFEVGNLWWGTLSLEETPLRKTWWSQQITILTNLSTSTRKDLVAGEMKAVLGCMAGTARRWVQAKGCSAGGGSEKKSVTDYSGGSRASFPCDPVPRTAIPLSFPLLSL